MMGVLQADPSVVGLAFALTTFFLLFFLKKLMKGRLPKILARNVRRIDDIFIYTFSKSTMLFMVMTSLYVGFLFTPWSKIYRTWSWKIFFCVLMLQVAIWASAFIQRWMQLSFNRKRKQDPVSATSIGLMEILLRGFFLVVIILFTLSNLGIEVTTMVAGLGVGGVAIALGIQRILSDLFSSLSIIMDKPFVVGDFIIIGETMGEVERIGLKTTRLRGLGGEEISISNSDILATRVRNMKRMTERRNVIVINLPHDVPSRRMKEIVSMIQNIVRQNDKVRLERCHFSRVNLTSLDIELAYWVLHDDFTVHMDVQQEILFQIHDFFLQEKIPYATPVRTLQAATENLPFLSRGEADAGKNHTHR